jgi:hypothetical protein
VMLEMKSINSLNQEENREPRTKRGLALSKLSGSRYQCRACGQHFAGPNAYGLHHDSVSAQCLSPTAMRDKGMTVNAAGFWAAPLARAREASNVTQAVTHA